MTTNKNLLKDSDTIYNYKMAEIMLKNAVFMHKKGKISDEKLKDLTIWRDYMKQKYMRIMAGQG